MEQIIKKFLIIFLSFFLLALTVKSQVLKTYSGNYQGVSSDDVGKATFTYYDDPSSGERIKQGVFTFTLIKKDELLGTFTKTISGSYKNNLKNGLWTYSLVYKDYYRSKEIHFDNSMENATGSIILKTNYKDGYPNGNCSYSYNLKQRDKQLYFGGVVYGVFSNLVTIFISMNFKNGVATGPIIVNHPEINITGQFDSKGNETGIWKTEAPTEESTTEYFNGRLVNVLVRQLPQGQITTNYHEDAKTKELSERFFLDANSKDSIESLGYTVNEFNCFTDDFPFIRAFIDDNTDFLYTKIPGDETLRIDDHLSDFDNTPYQTITDLRGGGYNFILKKNN